MSKLETNTIDTISGTSTLQVGDDNVATINLGKSGDTINIPSGATITNSGTANGFGGTNTPAFEAYLENDATPSNDVDTLVTFDTETFDTASAYNTADGKFTPQTAGKYFVYGSIAGQSTVDNGNLYKTTTIIYLNGSTYKVADLIGEASQGILFNRMSVPISAVLTLNGSSDFVQLYANIQTYTGGDVTIDTGSDRTFFGAYKIIE